MKIIRAALTVLLVLFAGACGHCEEIPPDAARQLSLKDAIDIAVRNNYPIQIQEQEIDYARANILDAQSIYYPQFNTAFGYTYNDAAFYTKDSSPPQRKDIRIFGGYKNDNLFTVSANQTVYNGGANTANLMQARLRLKVQQETLRARKLDVEFEAKRLYYGLLLAYETERITKELLENTRVHYDDVKAKFDQGTSSKFDVLQSYVEISKVMPELIKAQNAAELITAELKKLLSMSQEEPITLTGHLGYSLIGINEGQYLQEAYRNRPEMILRLLGIDIKKWAIEYAKAGYYPQVNAAGGYSYRSNDIGNMFNPRHDNWNLGVKATLNIFDGFSTKAKVDEAKVKYSQARLEKADIADQTAVDIKSACLDLKESKAIIDSQKDSIVEAKEAVRIAEIGYDNGVTTNLDVLDTLVSLSQVQKNLSEGIYDYLVAKAQLYRVMGREVYEEG